LSLLARGCDGCARGRAGNLRKEEKLLKEGSPLGKKERGKKRARSNS